MKLTIPVTTMEDSATYTIRLTNDHGVVEESCVVTVVCEEPRFTKPLHDAVVSLNQTATFECQVRTFHRKSCYKNYSLYLPPASEGWGKVLFSICQFTPRPGGGYPILLMGGYPPSRTGWGTPPPHTSRTGWGTPPPPRRSA